MVRFILLLCTVVLVSPAARAEDEAPKVPKALRGISGADVQAVMEKLLAPEMKGRASGEAGGKEVEGWVAGTMAEYGLHPADVGGTYLEPFTYDLPVRTGTPALMLEGTPRVYGTDFVDAMYSGTGDIEADVVFVGSGVAHVARGWNDFAGVDVKGKIVLLRSALPATIGAALGAQGKLGARVVHAAKQGAAGVLIVDGLTPRRLTLGAAHHLPKVPVACISQDLADALLGGKGALADPTAKARATGMTAKLSIKGSVRRNTPGTNAVGMIRGRDPDLTKEIVLVCARMDHANPDPGTATPAAQDQAASCALIMHLADRMTANRWKPKRSIVFCLFSGSEQGQHGAHTLAYKPPFHDTSMACVLDVTALARGGPKVHVSGGGTFPAMRARLRAAVPEGLRESVRFPRRATSRSDASVYREIGIPGLIITNAEASDDLGDPRPAKGAVDAASLERTAQVLGHMLVGIGGHEEPLASATRISRYLAREGPRFGRFALLDLSENPGRQGKGPLDAGVGVLTADLPLADEAKAHSFLADFGDQTAGSWKLVRSAGDVRDAWREELIGFLPRVLCADWFAKDEQAAHALAKHGFRLLAPFVGDAGAKLDAAKVATACAEAGVVLDLAGLEGDRLEAAWQARGQMPCVYLDKRAKDAGPPTFPEGVTPIVLLVPAPGASLVKPLSLEPRTVVLTGATAQLERDLSAVTLARSDMWWKPETAVRAHIRGFLGGLLESALATHR